MGFFIQSITYSEVPLCFNNAKKQQDIGTLFSVLLLVFEYNFLLTLHLLGY
jgi:hypothetical protein